MSDCIFCKIINGEIPSKMVYEDEQIVAFHDIQPVAPVHILILPKKHIEGCNAVKTEDEGLIGHIFTTAAKIAEKMGIAHEGYRIINNCGKNAGQTVHHIHFHLIGGVKMGEKLL